MQSILQKSSRANISEDPFPHIVVYDALDNDLYEALAAEFPGEDVLLEGKTLSPAGRCSYPARDILHNPRISPLWREFVSYHVSSSFYNELISLFGDHIRSLHPDLEAKLDKKLEDLEPGIRFVDQPGDIALECQLFYGAPLPRPIRVVGPHVDREVALYAGLLYFRLDGDDTDGGDLELYSFNGPRAFVKESRLVPDDCVKTAKVIRYQKNVLVLFPHSLDSLHGVTTRLANGFPRLHVNVMGELRVKIYDVAPYQTISRDRLSADEGGKDTRAGRSY